MIKAFLILASIISIATTAISIFNWKNYKDIRDDKLVLNAKSKNLKQNISAHQNVIEKAIDEQNKVKGEIAVANEQLRNINSEISSLESNYNSKKQELITIQNEMDEFEELKTQYGVSSIDELKNKLQSKNQQIYNLEKEQEKIEKELISGKIEKENINERLQKQVEYQNNRKIGIKNNSWMGTISSVNNEWGFAVVKGGKKSGITPNKQLIVLRNTYRIATLKINEVRDNITITEIDYNSIAPGNKILPGDRVILLEPNKG